MAGLGAYAYQFVGGQALGAERFAPVSVLLTIHFLVFIVVLLPIEQLMVRRLTVDRTAGRVPARAWTLAGAAGIAAVGYSWLGVDSLLRGDLRFVWFIAASVATHLLFVVGRGRLAGWRRFKSYGLASGAASLARLAIAVTVLAVRPTATGFALALIAGPLIIVAFRPGRAAPVDHPSLSADEAATIGETGLLSGLVLASAVSQILLLAGPLVVAALGGGEAAVSVAFATFTVSRAPLSFGYNLLARVLPPFTEMAARGQRRELRAWARGIGIASIVLAIGGAAVGALIGPPLVDVAFGSDFRPSAIVAALVAAGVVFAGASLFVGQILVARSQPLRLVVAWLAGGVAALAGLTIGDDPVQRVAAAFLAGEVAALGALVVGTVAVAGRQRAGYDLAKRSLDIAGAIIVLVLAVPIVLVSAIAIRLDSPGPAFFRQERVGKDGERFSVLKLRTMRAGAGDAVFTAHLSELAGRDHDVGPAKLRIGDDPRVTRVGRVLRALSIDEIPNLWNVLRGSMALVGPRPLVPAEAALIDPAHVRFTVKPGVTGLAQVSGRDEIDLRMRSDLDARYVETRSIRMDLRLLARTAAAVVRHRGR